ncbi:hypothetical protein E0L36_14695 [Streptomyces sp. AJS327]|uniref:hypothetical protein n=1 Tax=Streptomyces sp. AJS327 TaxID=2545265 RepID=UPI0015DD8880|nr:hypothetical protein [Streptomyces sp. AJS327]MBA0052104.1 hypothetical protein [Streptomyces sp. AJS327]
MSFDEQWAQHVAAAKADRAARTQLNQLAADGGGSAGAGDKLRIDPKLLRERAGKAVPLAKSFRAADDKAVRRMGRIGGGLAGFTCASAFQDFEERWTAQTRHVHRQLGEVVPRALRKAAGDFKKNEDDESGKYPKKK